MRRRPRARLADPDAWLEGHGWDVGPLGPLADRRRPRGGRARATLRALGARPPRPARQPRRARDGRRRRATRRPAAAASSGATPDGEPEGVLLRGGHPARHAPHPADGPGGPRGGADRGVSLELLALGVVAVHDPGRTRTGPGPRLVVPGLRAPVRDRPAAGPRPWPRCATTRSRRRSPAACAAARSLGDDPERPGPDRLAEVLRRRVARVADGGAPRRHRARAGPSAPARAAAWRLDHRARASARARRAGGRRRASRPRSTPSATRRSGPRSTPSSRRPRASRSCPGSSTSSCSIRPIAAGSPRPASSPASSPSTSGSDAAQARTLWGARAETQRLHLGLDRGDRRGHGVRHGRAGRAVRPVARDRARGPSRGSALAGRARRRSRPASRSASTARSAPPASARRSRRARSIAAG